VDVVHRPGSVEQALLRRRPARRQPGSFCRGAFLIEVGEELLDHHRVLDAGDDFERPAAGPTGLDVDAKYPLQPLRLKLIEARRSAGVGSPGSLVEERWLPWPRLAGLTRARCRLFGATTPWNRLGLTRGFGYLRPPAGR